MNKFILGIFLLLLCSFGTKMDQAKKLEDTIAYEAKVDFLNNLSKSFTEADLKRFKNVTFTNYELHFVTMLPDKLHKIKSSLKAGDFDTFIAQINEYEKLEIGNQNSEFIVSGFNLIPMTKIKALGKTYDEIWTNFKKKYGEKSLVYLSKPLLSKDLNLAIIEIQLVTDKSNTERKLYSFKKENGSWKLFEPL